MDSKKKPRRVSFSQEEEIARNWKYFINVVVVLMTAKENHGLFVIGAYRDEEVDSSHPLRKTLAALKSDGVTINEIYLHPLNLDHINMLLSDTLKSHIETVAPLGKMVFGKTGGNPFFVNHFLYQLSDDKLISFSPPEDGGNGWWHWDVEQIKALNITDNVVDLMIGKLEKLPDESRTCLRIAACAGNRFDLLTLCTITGKSLSETYDDLLTALKEGLIVSLFESKVVWSDGETKHGKNYRFQFSHDRVQQAAYTLIPDEAKQQIHLQIARLWAQNGLKEIVEDELFDIVEQYNRCINLLETRIELLLLSRLDLRAGRKAKHATAYRAAFEFFMMGRECLTNDDWEQEYDLIADLHVEAADAAFLSGDFAEMEDLIDRLLEKKLQIRHEVRIHQIQIQALAARNR